jgi:glycosyltransferase involved in cell wall biosynthesis
MRIALVSRGVHPFGGGGIGVQVAGAAFALREIADVTVVTSSASEEPFRELERAKHEDLPEGVRFAFVREPEPHEVGSYYSFMHLYSARVYAKLAELYGRDGVDVVEFADFLGEGVVTVQGRRAHERFLRDATVCVRLHTSAEMCSVLNGFVDDEFETRMVFAGERHGLRYADRLLPPGSDVLDTYKRFYGDEALAEATAIRPIVPPAATGEGRDPPSTSDGVRVLYMGRLERRKGVEDLLRAVGGLRRDNWSLTLLGGDTETASLGMSMREQLALAAADHPQITFVDGLPRADVPKLIQDHHVVVCPSRWECWPSVILESFEANRPVLATPTGGMREMVRQTGAGWVTGGRGDQALTEALERLLKEPGRVEELIASGSPRRAFTRLNDPDVLRSAYAGLAKWHAVHARNGGGPAARPDSAPLVSVVVPYFRLDGFIEETLQSVFDQDHERLEVILVNDGSLRPEDRLLAELASRYPIRVLTKENAGLGRARNAGIRQSRGRYVLPVDADNLIRPEFVSRCLEILEQDDSVAFVTTWSLYLDEAGQPLEDADTGFQPFGNSATAVMRDNVAGDATAVIRRRVFDLGHWYSPDLTSYEDWQFYRELHTAGLFGRVIPERLLLYRVRSGSMLREVGLPRRGRLFGEMQAQLRERQIEWQCRSD